VIGIQNVVALFRQNYNIRVNYINIFVISFIHSSLDITLIFNANRAENQHAKKPLPVITKGPMYVQMQAVITHNTNRREVVSFISFFESSWDVLIRYEQMINVTAPDAMANPAPSKFGNFSRNGLMEASIVTIEQNARLIMYFTSRD